jgi:hypothetical protein
MSGCSLWMTSATRSVSLRSSGMKLIVGSYPCAIAPSWARLQRADAFEPRLPGEQLENHAAEISEPDKHQGELFRGNRPHGFRPLSLALVEDLLLSPVPPEDLDVSATVARLNVPRNLPRIHVAEVTRAACYILPLKTHHTDAVCQRSPIFHGLGCFAHSCSSLSD